MSFVDDPTANEAFRNITDKQRSKYLEEEKQAVPFEPKSYPLKVALFKAQGKQYDTVQESCVSPYTDVFCMQNGMISRVKAVRVNGQKVENLKVVKVTDNKIHLNRKIARGSKVTFLYEYKVY